MNENVILNLGGGTSLNFKVVGNPQPTNPKENTIWLNTDVPIGRWYFSATQPEGLNAGDVWFSIGASSPVAFNALKKNGVMVYPISAKQYIDGALVDKTAKSHQDGEWVDWKLPDLVFFDGTLNTEVVGTMSGNVKNPSVSSGQLRCYAGGNQSNTANTSTHDKYIDVTEYNTLTLNAVSASYITAGTVRLINESGSSVGSVSCNRDSYGVKSIDISKVSGKVKLEVTIYANSTNDYIAFSSIIFFA